MFPDITCDDIFRLETPRLWLRWLRASDAPVVKGFASLEAVARMTASIPYPYPPGEAERFILSARAANAAGQSLIMAVTLKNKARTVIGLASAQAADRSEVEIGYVIAPGSTGRGFATEATTTLVDAIFNLTEARTIKANSRVINPASRRVLEKCGFEARGSGLHDLPARGAQQPCDFFTMDRFDWSARGASKTLPSMSHQAPRETMQEMDQQSQQQ